VSNTIKHYVVDVLVPCPMVSQVWNCHISQNNNRHGLL